jgi:hypothetical protein
LHLGFWPGGKCRGDGEPPGRLIKQKIAAGPQSPHIQTKRALPHKGSGRSSATGELLWKIVWALGGCHRGGSVNETSSERTND